MIRRIYDDGGAEPAEQVGEEVAEEEDGAVWDDAVSADGSLGDCAYLGRWWERQKRDNTYEHERNKTLHANSSSSSSLK